MQVSVLTSGWTCVCEASVTLITFALRAGTWALFLSAMACARS